jgi:hypothetical protein
LPGPAFFTGREELIGDWVAELDGPYLQPTALADAGGDVHAVRHKALGLQ